MLAPLTVDASTSASSRIYHDITEVQRAREHAETLLAVTQVLGKMLSLEETIEAILDQLQRVVPYDSCSVQVIQGNRLVIVGGRGFDDLEALLGQGFDLDDETNLNSQVVRSKRTQVFADVSDNPHFASDIGGSARIRGWICAPMIVGDRVVGVLSVDKFEPDFYDEELADVATAFAAQAAIAIQNARLLETERSAREQAETLRAAAQSLGSTLGMPEHLRSDPGGAAQGRSVRERQRPAVRRQRAGGRRRLRLPESRRAGRGPLRGAVERMTLPASSSSGARR